MISAPDTTIASQEADAQALARACHALWTATMSLMVAFMHTQAPAHRYLMARRISRNFATLQAQGDCFTPASRESFARLQQRWSDKADRLAPQPERPQGGLGSLIPAFLRGH